MDRDRIYERFATVGPVVVKRMFGGHGVFLDAQMFALEAAGEIFLKTDEASRGLFEDAGATPFCYDSKKGRVTTSYWRLPPEALDNDETFARWMGLALGAARRAGSARAAPRAKRRREEDV